MTAARCRVCDREPHHVGHAGSVCERGIDADGLRNCEANAIDWRARCLAAEASLREEESLCTTEVLARLRAEDIAREALVEGLVECERLRAMDSTLSAFDILIGAPSKEMTEADLVEAMARLVTDPPSPMMDAREGAAAREQAIRADAARAELERCATFLEAEAERMHGMSTGMSLHGDYKSGARYAIEAACCRSKARDIRSGWHRPPDNGEHAPGRGGEG